MTQLLVASFEVLFLGRECECLPEEEGAGVDIEIKDGDGLVPELTLYSTPSAMVVH